MPMIEIHAPGEITGLNDAAFTTDVITGRVSAATVNVTSML